MKVIVAASGLLAVLAACHSEENLGFTAVGQPRWAVSLGDARTDQAAAVAVDSVGDVVAAGSIWQPHELDGMQVGAPWPFITKRAARDGSERWIRELGGANATSSASVRAVAIGQYDTVIVVGGCTGTVDFGGQSVTVPPAESRMFVAAYAPAGYLLWVNTLNGVAHPSAVAVDAEGRIFVTGTFASSTLDFNGRLVTESEGDSDAFVVAFEPTYGSLRWGMALQAQRRDGRSAGPNGQDIAIAVNGDVIVAGGFGVATSFGGELIEPTSDYGSFVARYDRDGVYLAARAFGPGHPMVAGAPDVEIDAAGHIVIQQVERDDSFAADKPAFMRLYALDETGQELWSSRMEPQASWARTLALTRSGLIVSSGWMSAPGAMQVVTFDRDGASETASFGARLVGSNDDTRLIGTAASTTGALAFTGEFGAAIDFGTGPLTALPEQTSDVFIVMFDPPAPAP